VDFTVEVERSLRVLDGVCIIFCAVGGVQPQSETVWRQATKYSIPRLAFVNKMDRIGADFHDVLHQMRKRLGAEAVAIQLPIGNEEKHRGIVDLVEQKAWEFEDDEMAPPVEVEIPEKLREMVAAFREHLVVSLADINPALEEKFFAGEEPTADEMWDTIRAATIAGALVPVLCGSSFKNKGVQPLLDAIVRCLPSPLDVRPVVGEHPSTGAEETRAPDPAEPFSALAFKVAVDPFVGHITYIRCYSGTAKVGDRVLNADSRRKQRIQRLLRMHANRREDIEQIGPGDIVAAVGLDETTTGDTICVENAPLILERPVFPEPVIQMGIEPKSQADEDKLGAALARLTKEDPTLRVEVDRETGQQLLSGMGELHLEVIVDRLKREFTVEANVGRPRVAYRETIRKASRGEGRFVRQTGGRGQYGHVKLELEPMDTEERLEYEDDSKGDEIPVEFRNAVKFGINEAMGAGTLGGYPAVGVRCRITGGSYHDVDSSDVAFKIAAGMAFKDAFAYGNPVLLEPVMLAEVVTPEQYFGDVVNDLTTRRAQIVEVTSATGDSKTIELRVPLANMFGYATALRSVTQGRATYSMEPHSYEPVPAEQQRELLS